ncbi:hypothetical protein SCA6_001677 [Theobroma cacao]
MADMKLLSLLKNKIKTQPHPNQVYGTYVVRNADVVFVHKANNHTKDFESEVETLNSARTE